MEFIVDYNKKPIDLDYKKDELDSKTDDLQSNLESKIKVLDSINDNGISNPEDIEQINDDDNDEEEIITTLKRTKRKPSKKQLEALKKSREKAVKKIKENKQIRQQYIQEKQKEETGDLFYIKQKLEFYQKKLLEQQNAKEHVNDVFKASETVRHRMTDLDFMIDKMFK